MATEVYPWDLWNQRAVRKQQDKQRRKIRYGIGVLGGIVVVDFLKQRIRKLPVLGPIASPFLFLVPTLLVGPALGMAAVYGYEQGHPLAAAELLPKAREEVQRASQRFEKQVEAKGANITSRLKRLQQRAQQQVDDAVADMVTDVDAQIKQVAREVDVQGVIGRLESEFESTLQQIQPPPQTGGRRERYS